MLTRQIDPATFDPIAFLPTAQTMVRRFESDAELVELYALSVGSTGALDMSQLACVYTFRSSSNTSLDGLWQWPQFPCM